MAKQDYIFRYLSIIRKLRRSGGATFSEIRDFLGEQSAIHDRPQAFSIRTFQRDIREIWEIFRISVVYDFSGRFYYIENDDQGDMNNRMIESMETLHSLRMAGDMAGCLYFERRKASGSEHMFGLIHAIRNRIVLELTHQKFDDEEPTHREVAPFALKESRGRWYLVARDLADRKIKSFGLDRVLGFSNTPRRFDYPAGFDVNEHFRYCFGVINPDGAAAEEIILSFDAEQGKYIKSYPIHVSQQVVTDNKEELVIRLRLFITYDLVQEILSYGKRVRILSPEILRQQVLAASISTGTT